MLETTKIPMKSVGVNTQFVVFGWRFVQPDGRSDFQKTRQEPGTLYTVSTSERAIEATRWGFHVCPSALEAVTCGTAFWVERARLSGTIDVGQFAVAASERTPLWRADATLVLAGFAADCAERASKYLTQRGISPTAQTARYIQLARDFATGLSHCEAVTDSAKTLAEMERDTYGYEYTRNVPVCVSSAEQAAIHAARIFSGYECVDCSLRDAAEAFGAAADAAHSETVYTGERLWQEYELHDRLMALAPDGYEENPNA